MSRVPVVFIGGLGRSGSTLLDRLLAEVDGWYGFGELAHLWQRGLVEDERCGCGEPFSSCPVWQKIGDVAFGGWDTVDVDRMLALQRTVDRHRLVPKMIVPSTDRVYAERLRQYSAALGQVYRAIQEVTGARVLIDSTKHPSTAYLLRHVPDIDLHLVHLVRDSRGVAYSWTKTVRRPEATSGESFMTTYPPRRTAGQYLSYNLLLRGLGRTLPYVLVRYEDLVTNPGGQIRRIAAMLGEPLDDLPFLDGTTVTLGPNHNVGGNPMRFTRGDITLREDSAWREGLSGTHRGLVTGLTAPLLWRYGYIGGIPASQDRP